MAEWYAIKANTNYEDKIFRHVSALQKGRYADIIEHILLPKINNEKVMPGYVFVKCQKSMELFAEVRQVFGSRGVLSYDPMSPDDAKKIEQYVEGYEPGKEEQAALGLGDTVRIQDSFLTGIIVGLGKDDVTVDILGKRTQVPRHSLVSVS